MLVSCMVDLHNIENYNTDTGFKTGYLLELERMMARKLPTAYIKGKPYIEFRIKILKKDWSTIFDMVQGCGNSGFGWDSTKIMVTVEEPVWESYLIVSITYELFKNIYELLSLDHIITNTCFFIFFRVIRMLHNLDQGVLTFMNNFFKFMPKIEHRGEMHK